MVVSGPGSLSGLGEGWRAEGVWDSELEVVSAGPGRDPWGGDVESPRVGRLQMSNKGTSEVSIDLLNIRSVLRLSQHRLVLAHASSPLFGFPRADPFVSWHLGCSGLEVSRFWLPLTRFEKELVRRKHQGVRFKVHQL